MEALGGAEQPEGSGPGSSRVSLRSRRTRLLAGALALVIAAAGVVATLTSRRGSKAPEVVATPPTTVVHRAPRVRPDVDALTLIATVNGAVAYHDEPDGEQVGELPMGKWWRETKYLPVIETRGAWLKVRLPERPNGSTGWISADDATLSSTTYGIRIDTTRRRVQLYEGGKMVVEVPAGVGTEDDPTPLGDFYVMDVAEPPGPGWGPFVIDTNAHSETITSWQGSGDAFTAIHGPVGADAQIGTDGAAISHGCVRLHDEDLALFDAIVPGAPVVIVA